MAVSTPLIIHPHPPYLFKTKILQFVIFVVFSRPTKFATKIWALPPKMGVDKRGWGTFRAFKDVGTCGRVN